MRHHLVSSIHRRTDHHFGDNQSTVDDILADVLELDSEGNDCSSFTTFRYTAMDGCGNMTEEFYTQIREDNGAPVLTTPLEDLEFTCLGEVPSFDDQVFLLDVEDCQSPADGGTGYDVGLVATAVDEFEGWRLHGARLSVDADHHRGRQLWKRCDVRAGHRGVRAAHRA